MSGLVKGVKKVFKAIGNAVKKIIKSPIFKALLIGAAVIFTGGAALGAFGAAGSMGSIGGLLSSATSTIGQAFGAVTEALGIGGATAAPLAEGAAAATGAGAGATVEAGAGALAGDMGAGLGQMVDATGGLETAVTPATTGAADLFPEGMSSAMKSAADFTPQATQLTQSAGSTAPAWNLADAVPKPLRDLWGFIKPETPETRLLFGQTLSGLGQGLLSGRAGEADRAWRQQMSEVPNMQGAFQLKPNFKWSLSDLSARG